MGESDGCSQSENTTQEWSSPIEAGTRRRRIVSLNGIARVAQLGDSIHPVINDNYFCRSCCLSFRCYQVPQLRIVPDCAASTEGRPWPAKTNRLAVSARHTFTLR